jgi:hypothetical protein
MGFLKKYKKKKSLKKALRLAGAVAIGAFTTIEALPLVDDGSRIPLYIAIPAILGGIEFGRDWYFQNRKRRPSDRP